MLHLYRLSLLALLLATSSLAAADWTRFRGPNGFGISEDKNIPVTFKQENFLWKTELPGKGHSSPVVSKGKIFLQTSTIDGGQRALVCVDAKTGKVEWSKELKGTKAKIHDLNSLASCTPAADGERVYVVFWDGKKIAFTGWDYSGKLLWTKDLGEYVSQHGPGLSPMVVGDKVILNVDQDGQAEVIAFDGKTGNEIWKKSRTAFRACYTTPFLMPNKEGGESLVVASTAGVSMYDPKDGTSKWNWTWKFTSKMPLRNVGGPILHNGMIFAVSGDGGGDRHMVALKVDGSGEISDKNVVWEKKKGTPYVPMLLAHGDYVFWVTDKENVAVCVEAKTGKEVWQERFGRKGQVFASPVLIDGKIYSINENGIVFVFPAGPKVELLAENDLKEPVLASPAVADGRLYIRGEKHLFCIGKK